MLTQAEENGAVVPDDGSIHFQSEEGAGPERTNGFKGYSGEYGLFCRGAQRTFTDADLVAGVLTYTHNLNTTGVGVFIYNNTGALVQPSLVLIPYQVQDNGDNVSINITFDAALLPLPGTWIVMAIGF